MTKHILIRDDDVNYFTSFEQLQTVYGFMFEQGIPINFSVIPSIDASARTLSQDFGEGTYEPFIPAEHAGEERCYPLTDNAELVAQLRSCEYAEFLLHGFSHNNCDAGYEFEDGDRDRIEQKLKNGTELLRAAFGTTPTTFVAPQDQYSPAALRSIMAHFRVFSLGWIDRKRLPVPMLPAYVWKKLMGRNVMRCQGGVMLEHPGCMFSRFRDTERCMAQLERYIKRHRVTVVVVHHWEFFGDDGALDQKLHAPFRELVERVNRDGNCHLERFSELSEVLGG